MKESQLPDLGIKILTVENWLVPDPIMAVFAKMDLRTDQPASMTASEWVEILHEPKLLETVPASIIKLFEVARGAMLYGYFFYPLYTSGLEQVYRVAEAAITAKCEEVGIPTRNKDFADKIKALIGQNVLTSQQVEEWHGIWEFGNQASHPKEQMILPPGVVSALLQDLANGINALFSV